MDESYSWIYIATVQQSSDENNDDAACTVALMASDQKEKHHQPNNSTKTIILHEERKQTRAVPKEAVRRRHDLERGCIEQLKQRWHRWMLIIFRMTPRNTADITGGHQFIELNERKFNEIIWCLKSINEISFITDRH